MGITERSFPPTELSVKGDDVKSETKATTRHGRRKIQCDNHTRSYVQNS